MIRKLLSSAVGAVVLMSGLASLAFAAREALPARVEPVAQASAVPVTVPGGSATFTVRRLEGDVNGDCRVNINDDQLVAGRYGATVGSLLYSRMLDVNLPQTDGVINISDIQFVFGRNGSTCAVPIPPQPPLSGTLPPPSGSITLTKSPSVANIWLCNPGAGACGSTVPAQIGPSDWQNGVVFDEVMTVNAAIGGIEEYQFEVRYDPQVFQPPSIADQGVLSNGGLRTTTCTETDLPGDTIYHCTSTGPAGSAVQWVGARTLAKVTLLVQSALLQTIRPAKENGVLTTVQDTGVVLGSTSTLTPTATATATNTPQSRPANSPTVAPSGTGTPPVPTTAPPISTATPASPATTPAVVGVMGTPSSTTTPASGTPTRVSTVVGEERRPPANALPFTGGGPFSARSRAAQLGLAISVVAVVFLSWVFRRVSTRRRE
jgi:hypothetical protein